MMDFSRGERTNLMTALWAVLAGLAMHYGLPTWVVVFGATQVVFSTLSGFVFSGYEMQVAKRITQTILAANHANPAPKG